MVVDGIESASVVFLFDLMNLIFVQLTLLQVPMSTLFNGLGELDAESELSLV